MADAILVLNAGSSSIKFSLFASRGDELAPILRGQVEGLATRSRFVARSPEGAIVAQRNWTEPGLDHAGALEHIVAFLAAERGDYELVGVGHRVVHGGLEFSAPVAVTAQVIEALERLVQLAPLHQPHSLSGMRYLLQRHPRLAQVACFDTAFHRGNPDLPQRFALPAELHEAGVRRYGFHGLSYEFIASALASRDRRASTGRCVVLHLGNGASMCALAEGQSIASTMGFSPLDGLPMGTRCGALDPGVMLYLMAQRGLDARAIEQLVYRESGLLGVSGISSDMRTLEQSADPRAALAIDLFVYRIRRELGSLVAALGGLDALVFTGGIGENSAAIRARVVRDAAWLGVELDATANEAGAERISTESSRVSAWKLATDEELMIARHTRDRIALLLPGVR